jgi:c-di-GMP-binding flagellar brake protein YcgR
MNGCARVQIRLGFTSPPHTLKMLKPEPGIDLLNDAVARGAAAVISLPTDGELHHHKTRFLGRDEQGVWLESIAGHGMQIESMIASGVPVGVSFRGEPNRVAFCSRILSRDNEFRVNDACAVRALLLEFPNEVTPIQRRASYRVTVPLESELSLRIWRIPEHVYLRDRPTAAWELPCRIRNISEGGVGLMIQPKSERPVRLVTGERLRLQLAYREIDFIIEGRVRHAETATANGVYVGVQFNKLENDLEGRQTLASINAIIGELQRDEVRRTRMGVLEG